MSKEFKESMSIIFCVFIMIAMLLSTGLYHSYQVREHEKYMLDKGYKYIPSEKVWTN